MKEIEILILPDGSVKMEGKGFSGPECQEAMKALKEALGTVVSEENKPEFYQRLEVRKPAWQKK